MMPNPSLHPTVRREESSMAVVGLNHYNLRAPLELLYELRNFYCDVVG